LLAAVGDGVELTGSGFLPPYLVQELCPALGVDPILAGKANRESNVAPLAMFREAARRAGLLQVSGRTLRPTAVATRIGEDAPALWRHVAASLPHGDDELTLDAGWFTLLALAGGVENRELYDVVHELCVDSGWVGEDEEPVAFYLVNELVWPTLAAVVGARWHSSLDDWPSWAPAAAASVIFTPAE
jgi:hypothetical protein